MDQEAQGFPVASCGEAGEGDTEMSTLPALLTHGREENKLQRLVVHPHFGRRHIGISLDRLKHTISKRLQTLVQIRWQG